MPRNGSGTYNLPAGNPVVTGTTISTTWANNTTSDIATALSGSLAADGQTPATGDLPMGGNQITNLGSGLANRGYAANIADVQDGTSQWAGTAGGTADALTLTLAPPITAYTAPQFIYFKAALANTGAATVAVNGLAAKAIQNGGVALGAGAIAVGSVYLLVYDGVAFQILPVSTTVVTIPVGAILDFGGTAAPSGFLACDGSAVNRALYSGLFTAIGTTWGVGDGVTTFNVPNFQRRAAVGSGGAGTATLGNAVGNTGGEETHALTTAELATHSHGVTDPTHTHTISDPTHAHGVTDPTHTHTLSATINANNTGVGSGTAVADGLTSAQVDFTIPVSGGNTAAATGVSVNAAASGVTNVAAATGVTTQNAGSGTAHNTIQPSAVVLKIIKF